MLVSSTESDRLAGSHVRREQRPRPQLSQRHLGLGHAGRATPKRPSTCPTAAGSSRLIHIFLISLGQRWSNLIPSIGNQDQIRQSSPRARGQERRGKGFLDMERRQRVVGASGLGEPGRGAASGAGSQAGGALGCGRRSQPSYSPGALRRSGGRDGEGRGPGTPPRRGVSGARAASAVTDAPAAGSAAVLCGARVSRARGRGRRAEGVCSVRGFALRSPRRRQ